jgi:hypothetical protein
VEIADVLETYASFRIDLTGFVRAKMNIALRKRAVTFIIGFFVGLATTDWLSADDLGQDVEERAQK